MFSKVFTPKGHIVKIIRSQCRQMSEYSVKEYKQPHMDEIPIPKGSWEEGFKRKQVSNNAVLAFGIVFFASTFAYVRSTKILDFNTCPPLRND